MDAARLSTDHCVTCEDREQVRTISSMSSASHAAGVTPARTQTLFGRVMALVALTVGFATLGVYVARDLGGPEWFIAWLIALSCLIGLNGAS